MTKLEYRHQLASASGGWEAAKGGGTMSAAVNGMASSALVPSATAGSAGGGGDQANGIERLRELEAMFLGGPVNAIDSKLNEVRMVGLSTMVQGVSG